MKCHLKNRDQVIEDYLSGHLSEREREAFEEHLFNCDVCYREVRLRETVIQTIREEGETFLTAPETGKKVGGKPRFSLRKLFLAPSWQPALAGAFVLIVLISTLIFYKGIERTSGPQKTPTSQPAPVAQTGSQRLPSKPAPAPPNPARQGGKGTPARTAPNFVPSPLFEEILSSTTRSPAVEILTPPPAGKIVSQPVHFQWKGGRGPFLVRILNNRGEEVFRARTTKHQLDGPPKLLPGLYYWKLETEEELLYLGKFTVPGAKG